MEQSETIQKGQTTENNALQKVLSLTKGSRDGLEEIK